MITPKLFGIMIAHYKCLWSTHVAGGISVDICVDLSQSDRCRVRSDWSSIGPLQIAHSQMTATRQPDETNASIALASLLLFFSILARQNSVLVDGSLKNLQSCPCQKHPWINMTAWNFENTISGLPGMPDTWSRYRNPAAWSARLTKSSGLVFFERIARMFFERMSGLWTSAIFFAHFCFKDGFLYSRLH